MKVKTYLQKIKKENACSINTANNLTRALHREEKLNKIMAIRFKPLYGKFDIVNADYEINGLKKCYTDDLTIDNLIEMFE